MIYAIFLTLNFAHFLGDFTPLNKWFVEAKRYGKPIGLVAGHGTVNGALYGLVMWLFVDWKTALLAFTIETITHTIIDVAKGRINRRFPIVENANKQIYWTMMGFDQLLHQAVLVFIVFLSFEI